jgi:hypothetical protein
MNLDLQPKQAEVLNSPATEILYGGAAYGGKSYLLRVLAIALCYDIPGLQVYLFRRTYPDLIANHMNGSMSFPEMLAPFINSKQVYLKEGEIVWSNGSRIHLCHCQHEKDVLKYQGAEIHVLLMDELTSFTEYVYRFLRNRVRLGSRQIPEKWKKKVPLIVSGSNPGGIGHAWVKRTFIDMQQEGIAHKVSDEEGGMIRQFIQSKSSHNPIGMKNDPGYIARLAGLGSEALIRAMRDGDWNIVAGAAFENLNRGQHCIRPFDIPQWWTKFTSLDWGSTKPYSMSWYTIADEQVVLKARESNAPDKIIGKGSIIMYRELYGWNGRPNEGLREESWEVAKKIKALEPLSETINYRIADSAMWAVHDGPSIAERMMDALDKERASCPTMEQSRKDRKANYLEIRNRLSNSVPEGEGFYVFDNCFHFWRTVPDLQLDERDPEKGWDSAQEDHVIDQVGYALVSRPSLMDKKTYNRQQYDEAQDKARAADRNSGKKNTSRY